MSSALYAGHLSHARGGAVRNSFRYPVYFALLDLGELDRLARDLRLFSRNRPNLFSFYDRDYRGGIDRSAEGAVRALLAERGAGPIDRVLLLTQLRVLGYVFNPVSFFYAYRPGGELACVIAEVNNTYGQTYRYVLDEEARSGAGPAPAYRTRKSFFVSPFLGDDYDYEWRFPSAARAGPGERHEVTVSLYRGGEKCFAARLAGRRRPLDDRALLRAFARYPLMPQRIIGLIHWQALRLRARGLPYRRPDDTG